MQQSRELSMPCLELEWGSNMAYHRPGTKSRRTVQRELTEIGTMGEVVFIQT